MYNTKPLGSQLQVLPRKSYIIPYINLSECASVQSRVNYSTRIKYPGRFATLLQSGVIDYMSDTHTHPHK